jgi:hypothetical protein
MMATKKKAATTRKPRRPRARKRTSVSRTTPRRPQSAAAPLTKAQDRRYSLMRTTGVDRQMIANVLRERGVVLTRQAVGNVIRNRFVNDDVIAVFCELTGATREKAWPDVPEIDTSGDEQLDGAAIERVRAEQEQKQEADRARSAREKQQSRAS